MTKIRFNPNQISAPEITAYFEQYMFDAKAAPIGDGAFQLGALTIYPEGIIETTVSKDNMVLQIALEDFRNDGFEYEFL